MQLEIISPDKTIFSGEASSVKFPGSQGVFEVLNNHAPLISTLAAGNIRVKHPGGSLNFEIPGGVVEVLKNKLIVLVG